MQIVIDIPEEEYKCVQITGCIGNKTCISNAIYNGTPLPNCPIKHISNEDMYIPYLMHKEMDIPISECQKAYNIAMEYLRNKSRLKG